MEIAEKNRERRVRMLRKFKDLHAGETCVIMGNGPSLIDVSRTLLANYPTFGVNKVYLLKGGYIPTYYTVIDEQMLMNISKHISTDDFAPKAMFIRRPYPIPGCHWINCVVESSFSRDINEKVVMGGTVTYANLQIAYYMGFTTALLVGVDHDYGKYNRKTPGGKFLAQGSDNAHFHPDYFTHGEIYNAPELKGTEIMYALANMVWMKDNRKIINLTPDTKLEEFDQGKYQEWEVHNATNKSTLKD
jgi:hypothetical protein